MDRWILEISPEILIHSVLHILTFQASTFIWKHPNNIRVCSTKDQFFKRVTYFSTHSTPPEQTWSRSRPSRSQNPFQSSNSNGRSLQPVCWPQERTTQAKLLHSNFFSWKAKRSWAENSRSTCSFLPSSLIRAGKEVMWSTYDGWWWKWWWRLIQLINCLMTYLNLSLIKNSF